MAEILLFHHVMGLTAGVHRIADHLRDAGHIVHTPDLFGGATYDSLEAGFAAYLALGGPDAATAKADEVAAGLPTGLVYVGMSLGVMQAQRLAQTRPGAIGAVLLEACVPPSAFGAPWPADVPVQVHGMEHDPFFGEEGDADAARELVETTPHGELFIYPGDVHLFTDSSLPSYDEPATRQVLDRIRAFLQRL